MTTEQEIYQDTEEYRDQIATVDGAGKRIWLYPKKPKGRFYDARTWVSLVFLVLFLTIPFIKVNGEQFMLLNILERKFVIFGIYFSPQDFHLFGLLTLTFLVFIILFTVVFGRLFCGWVCPQTVFLEMIFRKIEYWIEGDASQQRKLDASPWTSHKIQKKVIKHVIFFAIAVVVANYFLAYIIGTEKVLKIITDPVGQHFGGFLTMLGFSLAFYGVFARLREMVCTVICPYGRLQGVLLVKDSIVVAYDFIRGEPRGKIKKEKKQDAAAQNLSAKSPSASKISPVKIAAHHDHDHENEKEPCQNGCAECPTCASTLSKIEAKLAAPAGVGLPELPNFREIEINQNPKPGGFNLVAEIQKAAVSLAPNVVQNHSSPLIPHPSPLIPHPSLGDCIDCKLCIAVCPTGIDIRHGTQLECTNCTACIDACDEVMDKVSRPRGLIRYDSMTGIENQKRKIFTPRVIGYSALLALLILVDVVAFSVRGVVETMILRAPGQMYQPVDAEHVKNLYTFQIINKSSAELPVRIQLNTPGGEVEMVGQVIEKVAKGGMVEGAFFVKMPIQNLTGRKTKIEFEVFSGDKKIDAVKTNFMGLKK